MDTHELNEAVQRQLEKAYWPWWFALAYCRPPSEREAAIREAVATFIPHVETEYAPACALDRIAGVAAGKDPISAEEVNRSLPALEAGLLSAINSRQVQSLGRPDSESTLQVLNPSDWAGSEVHYARTCDLIKDGWRMDASMFKALHGERVVRFFDIHLPREEVISWVKSVDRQEAASAMEDEILAGLIEGFELIEAKQPSLKGGAWSALVAGAWVSSKCESFTAATQQFEAGAGNDQAGIDAGCTWWAIDALLRKRFDRATVKDGLEQISDAVNDCDLPCARGYDVQQRQYRMTALEEWSGVDVAHDHHGTRICRGYVYNVVWSSRDVRAAFPVNGNPAYQQIPASPPLPEIDPRPQQEAWAVEAVGRNVTITDAREDAVQNLGVDLAPDQELARGLLRAAYERSGTPVKPGRPKGSKTTHKKASR